MARSPPSDLTGDGLPHSGELALINVAQCHQVLALAEDFHHQCAAASARSYGGNIEPIAGRCGPNTRDGRTSGAGDHPAPAAARVFSSVRRSSSHATSSESHRLVLPAATYLIYGGMMRRQIPGRLFLRRRYPPLFSVAGILGSRRSQPKLIGFGLLSVNSSDENPGTDGDRSRPSTERPRLLDPARMNRYNPLKAPIRPNGLRWMKASSMSLVQEYHRRAKVRLPNQIVHAAIHAIVETQIAGHEVPGSRSFPHRFHRVQCEPVKPRFTAYGRED